MTMRHLFVRSCAAVAWLAAGIACSGSSQQQPGQSSAPECPSGKRLANGTCPAVAPASANFGAGGRPGGTQNADAEQAALGTGSSPASQIGAPDSGGAAQINGGAQGTDSNAAGNSATATAAGTAPSAAVGTGTSTATYASQPLGGPGGAQPPPSATAVPVGTNTLNSSTSTGFAASGTSPATSTDPVVFVNPTLSAADGVPAVKLVASIAERKLLVYAALSHVDRVTDFTYQYGRDKYPLAGQPLGSGDFAGVSVAIPVVVTFTFDGHHCRVQTSADFTERQYRPDCD